MRLEVDSAATFICSLIRCKLSSDELARFADGFRQVLYSRYSEHWFPEKPFKGSAFRCIRIVKRCLDPVLSSAAAVASIDENRLLSVLPSELTLWVDPSDVCYRIGEDGSIGNLFSGSSSSSSGLQQDCRQEIKPKHSTLSCQATPIAV